MKRHTLVCTIAAAIFTLLPCTTAAAASILGDVNGDGVVNAVDVQLVINAALGIETEHDEAADINGDGVVNAIDVQLVINIVLGLLEPPQAGFEAAPTSGMTPLEVHFEDQSVPGTSSITAWYWDFGDGTTSDEQNPVHVYEAAGEYTVSLRIETNGLSHRRIKPQLIQVGSAPEVYPLPSGGPAPLEVTFEYADPVEKHDIASWAWDLTGDGQIDSTDPFPVFLYEDPGVYDIVGTIELSTGETITWEQPAAVEVREPVEPLVYDNVILIDNEPDLSFVSLGVDELHLEYMGTDPLPVQVGDIIIGLEAQDGYARYILDMDQSGNELFLTTDNASLAEIFAQADISGLIEFTDEDLRKAGFKSMPDGSKSFPFDNLELAAGITLSGQIEFKPKVDWDARLRSPAHFRCAIVGPLTARLQADINIEGGWSETFEEPLLTVTRWDTVWIGYVPVVIRSAFTIVVGVKGEIGGEASLSTGYVASPTVKFGAEYTENDGFSPILGPRSLNLERFGPDFDFGPGGFLKAYVKPKATVHLFGVTGPKASLAGYVRGDMEVLPEPELKLSLGLKAELGYDLANLEMIGIDFGVGITGEFPVYEREIGRFSLATGEELRPARPAFMASPGSGLAPLTVDFVDASDPGDEEIVAWRWEPEFSPWWWPYGGDGPILTGQHVTHTYTNPGIYLAGLTIETGSGEVRGTTQFISVSPPHVAPTAFFHGAPTRGPAPLTVQFTDQSTPGTAPIEQWAWDLTGDGEIDSFDQHPTHTYTDPGIYDVALLVETDHGHDLQMNRGMIQVDLSEPTLPAPTPQVPGSSEEPGPVLTTLQPTLGWSAVAEADMYQTAVSIEPYGEENVVWSTVTSDTSAQVEDGHLQWGERYRWNVRALTAAGDESAWSIRLYFQTGQDEPDQYTLSVQAVPQEGGIIDKSPPSDAGGRYDAGTEVTLTPQPFDGWTFSHWSGDASGTSPSITVTMDEDRSISAHFSEDGDISGVPISSIEELQLIGNDPEYPLDGDYVLTQNIDASATANWNGGAGFDPIGPFTGSFNGQGHVITNLTINRPDENYVGLFRWVEGNGIRNIGIEGGTVTGSRWVGGLVGQVFAANLVDCYATCDVSGSKSVGGLVGALSWGDTSRHCYATGDVSGTSSVGGLVGFLGETGIEYSYATGSVVGTSSVGGLVGEIEDTGWIRDCYATGAVTGSGEGIGGLVGLLGFLENSVNRCYSVGFVSGSGQLTGGLIGRRLSDITPVNVSFWDVNTSGMSTSDGGTGLSTAQMQTLTTFTNAGWDFGEVWYMPSGGGYPRLRNMP